MPVHVLTDAAGEGWHRLAGSPHAQVRIHPVPPRAIALSVRGDIDQAEADATAEHLLPLLVAGHEHQVVVLDLSGVAFFGSAGLDLLVRARRASAASGIPVHGVLGDQPMLRRVLRITGLSTVIPWFPSIEAATSPDP